MAILFRLELPGDTPRERFLNAVEYLSAWLAFIGFRTQKVELWEESYLIAEDGKKISEFNNIYGLKSKVVGMDITRIDKLITLIKGIMRLDYPVMLESSDEPVKLNELPAYLYIFDRGHRMSLRAYALFYVFMIPDWKLFLSHRSFREKITKSVKNVERGRVKLRALIIGKNQFAAHDVRYQVFCYYRRRREFIEDLLKTIKEDAEERKEEQQIELISPYNIDYLASALDSYGETFNHRLKEFFKEKISLEAGSIQLSASTEDAFELFYQAFRDDFLSFFQKEFPDGIKIKSALRKWVTKSTELQGI